MLYTVEGDFEGLKSVDFLSLEDVEKLEKHLEVLIADHLPGTLFEENMILPFHQERRLQREADIYGIDERGDVVVFELKRSLARRDALSQVLRYTEDCSKWSYEDLNRKYQNYTSKETTHSELSKPVSCIKAEDLRCEKA